MRQAVQKLDAKVALFEGFDGVKSLLVATGYSPRVTKSRGEGRAAVDGQVTCRHHEAGGTGSLTNNSVG